MHYHSTITITTYADTLPELLAEMSLHCRFLPPALDVIGDEWTTKDPQHNQVMSSRLGATSGHAHVVMSAHTDAKEN